jgi:hypothetical protein
MVSLLPIKFHEMLFSRFRGVALTNCLTDRRTDGQTVRRTDEQTKTNMSPHQSGADIIHSIYTLDHKLGTTKFEMENIFFYIALFSC